MTVRVGLTLPSFRDTPTRALELAAAADAAGLDGVFAFDHLFRLDATGGERPAAEALSLLGALAASTSRITLGTLVLRATLRPAATAASALETVQRICHGRLVAAVGSGDRESRPEMEHFGLPFGSLPERVDALGACVASIRDLGIPTWVGGSARHVGAVAIEADGWNRWGLDPAGFGAELASLGALAEGFVPSWGGLVVLADDDEAAVEKARRLGAGVQVLVGGPARVARALHAYCERGARWVILGPVDSAAPENVPLVAAVRSELLALA